MNDEFLYRLRKDPPPKFAAQLKARLNLQASASARRFSTLRTVLFGLLIGGSTLAATLWAVKGAPEGYANLFGADESARADAPPTNTFLPSAAHRSARNAARDERADDMVESAQIDPVNRFESDAQTTHTEEIGRNAGAQSAPSALIGATVGLSGGEEARPSQARAKVASSPLTRVFATTVAERYKFEALDVESIEARDAFQTLCEGTGKQQADVVLASRSMTDEEMQGCARSGITNIAHTKIGYHGVVITAAKTANIFGLSTPDLFLALAKQIPDPVDPTRLIDNTSRTWNQVNHRLEVRNIAVFGPAPKSALGTAVSELVMEVGCDTYPWIKALKEADPKEYRRICHTIREDGVYVVSEQTNILVTQKLWAEPSAIAFLGVTFFDQHRDELIGNLLDGPEPTLETIDSGAYRYARVVHLYANQDRTRAVPSADRFFHTFLSGHMIGWLARDGFIPLREAEYPLRAERLRIPGWDR